MQQPSARKERVRVSWGRVKRLTLEQLHRAGVPQLLAEDLWRQYRRSLPPNIVYPPGDLEQAISSQSAYTHITNFIDLRNVELEEAQYEDDADLLQAVEFLEEQEAFETDRPRSPLNRQAVEEQRRAIDLDELDPQHAGPSREPLTPPSSAKKSRPNDPSRRQPATTPGQPGPTQAGQGSGRPIESMDTAGFGAGGTSGGGNNAFYKGVAHITPEEKPSWHSTTKTYTRAFHVYAPLNVGRKCQIDNTQLNFNDSQYQNPADLSSNLKKCTFNHGGIMIPN